MYIVDVYLKQNQIQADYQSLDIKMLDGMASTLVHRQRVVVPRLICWREITPNWRSPLLR